MTKKDEDKVRVIVREETAGLRTEVRRNSVLLEDLDHKISAIAENVSTSMENSHRMNNLDERLTVVEHLNGIGV